MAKIQRNLTQFLEDLDRRARPGRAPRNRPLQQYEAIDDTVFFSSDTQTVTLATGSYFWHPAASTEQSLIWGLGQWSS